MSSLNLNEVFIAGRLTDNIELKTTQNQKFVTAFDIAVNMSKDTCYFIPCVAFEKKAEFISTNFVKGSPIFVRGELHSRKYTDKDGKNRVAYEVKVNDVKFNDSTPRQTEQTEPVPPLSPLSIDEDSLPF